MLAALKKQLQDQRRAALRPDSSGPAPTAALPSEPDLAEHALPPLSPQDADRLAAVRDQHPALHASLSGLDAAQLGAVLSAHESLLVRAPVGSGKTAVLVHKVLYLHFVCGVPLQQMAVVTFTNRAALEIRTRIEALAGRPLDAEEFWLTGTFHSVARALLARCLPVERLGYRRDFTVLDEAAQEALLDELLKAHRLRIGRRATLPKRLRQLVDGQAATGRDLQQLAQLYGEEKRRRNAMDFDDLIAHASALLGELALAAAPDPGEASASTTSAADAPPGLPPRWLIVDEMQDCEPRELALLSRLRGPRTGFFAVGDPNQAIYSWRGSAPELFVRAEATFGCRSLTLPRNYRSTRTIVEGARAVLGLQPATGPGTAALMATRSLGERMVVRRHHDPLSEALYLAERIARLHAAGVPYREIAILFRLRAQAEPLRATLTARQIPCSEPEEEPGDAVRLLTLHAAKGLEFRQVFLSGINDGLVPLGPRFDLCADAEERRLLFVGLTRARDHVEISYHTRPHEFCALPAPSPYLSCIPAALLSWDQDLPADPATAPASSPPAAPAVPTAPAPPPAAAPASAPWSPGQAVRHPRYGTGTVTRVADGTVSCSFGKLGEKSFSLALCPLAAVS